MSTPFTLTDLQSEFGSSQDVVHLTLVIKKTPVHILYLSTMCDEKVVQTILDPIQQLHNDKDYWRLLNNHPKKISFVSKRQALHQLLHGAMAIQVGRHELCLIQVSKVINDDTREANIESAIQGPQSAFCENIEMNVTILRHRYYQKTLQVAFEHVGSTSKTNIALVYDSATIDKKLVQQFQKKLATLHNPVIQTLAQLSNELSPSKLNLFPTMLLTERPDRAILNLSQGKLLVLMEGTPYCLIAPSVFQDFLATMDDISHSYWIGRFLFTLRYIALFICTTLPAMYVGVTAFNTEFFRIQLVLAIASSRINVPYPAFIEVLLMLLMMELLTEASIRLPETIGSTATTVGGLILGEAATTAGLVSSIMVIIVAAVAISNFVIPINSMSFAFRLVKYVLIALTTFFGVIGLTVGVIGLVAFLVHHSSMGRPFLQLQFAARNNQLSTQKKR